MMPSGVPKMVAHRINRPLPAMALAKPPPAVFGGGVISVNSASDMPSKPLVTVANRIQISQNRPNAMAASDSVSAMTLMRRRFWPAFCGAMRPAVVALMCALLRSS